MQDRKDSPSEALGFFRKTSKELSVLQLINEAHKSFFSIESTSYSLIVKNKNKNADEVFKLNNKTNEKTKSQKVVKTQQEYMKAGSKMHMEPAILPSKKHWDTIEQSTTKKIDELVWNQPFSLKSVKGSKSELMDNQLVMMNGTYFTVNTALLGLNKHLTNPNIYFMVSPNYGYMHKLSNSPSLEEQNQSGRIYLVDAINCVNKSMVVNKKLNCIVLGNRALNENMDTYMPWLIETKQTSANQRIRQYNLPKENSNATTDVTVFNIDADGHELNIESADLETLHQIASCVRSRDESSETIMVHCQQGKDRTGMFIFAMILFENYSTLLFAKNNVDKLYEEYKTIQLSRSPEALTKVADLVNAFYLAHTLAAIDIEKKSFIQLEKVDCERKNALIMSLLAKDTIAQKLQVLEEELKSQGLALPILEPLQKTRPRSASYTMNSNSPILSSVKKSASTPDDLNDMTVEVKVEQPFLPAKTSGKGLFQKRKSVNKSYCKALECYALALQHRKNTELALLHRVKPQQTVTNCTSMSVMTI